MSGSLQPRADEVMNAIRSGYQTIDEGDEFWEGFEKYLVSLGYVRVSDAPCICPDNGRHGHLPECRWIRRS